MLNYCDNLYFTIFQLVTNFSPKPDDMFHALKSVNLCKNRKLDMVPLSVKRVILPMKPGVEGSDYINATYLQVRFLLVSAHLPYPLYM
jgi:receptor-type tyrosine-protein phosphatase gamma